MCLDLVSAIWNSICFVPQASSKRQHHLNKHLYRPSTFLTSYEPPVFMDEDDEHAAYFGGVQDPSADDSVSPPSHRSNKTSPEFIYLLPLPTNCIQAVFCFCLFFLNKISNFAHHLSSCELSSLVFDSVPLPIWPQSLDEPRRR